MAKTSTRGFNVGQRDGEIAAKKAYEALQLEPFSQEDMEEMEYKTGRYEELDEAAHSLDYAPDMPSYIERGSDLQQREYQMGFDTAIGETLERLAKADTKEPKLIMLPVIVKEHKRGKAKVARHTRSRPSVSRVR